MILAKEGVTSIRGTALQVMQEYLAINCSILHTQPEMFVAVQSLLAEETMELFPQLDSDIVSDMRKEAKEFIENNKKAGTWND